MKNSYAAWALAFALAGTPLALAQQEPGQHGPDQNHGQAPEMTAQPAQHLTTQRPATAQPPPMAMQNNTAPPRQPMTMQRQPPPAMQRQPPPQGQRAAMAPSHDWRQGDRFTGDRRVITNWRDYHAHQPPPGYEWVQDGNQLVLISITSGVIAHVLAKIVQ
jgi:Ni/Co efflux regulator RcnB